MRKTREILRLKWALGRSHREVGRSLGISSGAVGSAVLRAQAAGLAWAQVQALTDDALEARLYGRPKATGTRHPPEPDCTWLRTPLSRDGNRPRACAVP